MDNLQAEADQFMRNILKNRFHNLVNQVGMSEITIQCNGIGKNMDFEEIGYKITEIKPITLNSIQITFKKLKPSKAKIQETRLELLKLCR